MYVCASDETYRRYPARTPICSTIAAQGLPLCVKNIERDRKLAKHPVISAHPQIASYFGFPVFFSEESPMGVLCGASYGQPTEKPDRAIEALSTAGRAIEDMVRGWSTS